MKRKLGIESDDEIFVGTPDMFRGVEKDILIVVQLRNSTISGLG
jgi:superfamily I DNA and/or RNA helicase